MDVSGANRGDGSEVASDTSQPTSTMVPTASSDHHSLSLQITSFKLNGRNFLQWSRSVQLVVRGKGKIGYLDGSIPQPDKSDSSFPSWDIHNSMVMSWLINSMEESIAEIYLLYPTAKAIWDVVSLAYSDLEDSSQLFDLRTRSRQLRQADSSVTHYFNHLKKLWQELDLFNQHQWRDPNDAAIYQKILAKERVYDFLAGLHPSLDDVRGRILSAKPLPSIDEIFAEVRREEQRRRIMLGPSHSPATSDTVAMAARHSTDNRRKPMWCDHCQRPYHTKATCWKIHGKPADWVPHRLRQTDGKVLQAASNSAPATTPTVSSDSPSVAPFSKAQLEHLSKLFPAATLPSSSSSHMVQQGTFSGLSLIGEPWIIDSGASDHMTGTGTCFLLIKLA